MRRAMTRAVLAAMCVLGVAAPPAAAQGAPGLFAERGYLALRGAEIDGWLVTDTVSRVDERNGRTEASVNVLELLEPGYERRELDRIDAAVHCGDVVWFLRATIVDGDSQSRLYRLTATDGGQVTSAELNTTFSGRDLDCAADGSAYVTGTTLIDGTDDFVSLLLRVRPDGTVTRITPEGMLTPTRTGVAIYDQFRLTTTLLDLDGTRRAVRPRNASGIRTRGAGRVYDGNRLYVVERSRNGPVWLRRFGDRGRGQRFDGLRVDVASTWCGGLVVTRVLTLSSTEVLFMRGGRVVRRVRSEASPQLLDPRRGRFALLGRRVYDACGAKAGRVRTVLRKGAVGHELIGTSDFT